MKAKTLSAMLLFAALAACDSTKPPEYDDVNGTFEGLFTGADGILALQGTATFDITQTDGDLSANLTLNGTVSFRGGSFPLSETYEVTGTITRTCPEVNFTLPKGQDCPDLSQIKLTGTHNSEMRKIELTGVFSVGAIDECYSQVPVTVTVTKK